MLRSMRGPDGGPSLAVRALAVLVILGMAIAAAPLIVIPVIQYLFGLLH